MRNLTIAGDSRQPSFMPSKPLATKPSSSESLDAALQAYIAVGKSAQELKKLFR